MMTDTDKPHKLFLPLVEGGPTSPPPPPWTHDPRQIKKDVMARNIYNRIGAIPGQGREITIWNPKLETAACKRVIKMADEGWQGHVDPEGKGPDWYVRQEGYSLPSYYYDPKKGDAANHVESLSYGGDPTSSDEEQEELFWSGLIGHEAHRVHLAGEGFFADQVEVGVCVVLDLDSPMKWYLSIITAPPEGVST